MRQRGQRMQRIAAAVLKAVLLGMCCAPACGDDDADSGGAGQNTAGDRGGANSGQGAMTRPDGGSAGTTGTDGETYRCKATPVDPGGTRQLKASCCGGRGVCTAAASAQPGLPHDSCDSDPDLRCQPNPPIIESSLDAGADDGGTEGGSDDHCRVQLPGTPIGGPDYEGRCVASCFAQNLAIYSRLSQATCGGGEICAPCYDPLSGASTGTCARKGDKPSESKPKGFSECGENNAGYCVPSYAAGTQASQLSQLTCKTGELCAPKIKAANPNACFPHCTSDQYGPGACVPDFLAGSFSALLTQMDCGTSEYCAPCELFGTRLGVCD